MRSLVAPATVLAALHVLLDVVVGAASWVLVVTGLALTVGLMPLALLGVPVWIGTVSASTALAALERARYRVLLGVDLPATPLPPAEGNLLCRASALLRDPGVQRRIGHQLLALPLGICTSCLAFLLLSGSLSLLALAVFPTAVAADSAFPFLTQTGGRVLSASLGMLLLLLSPTAVRGLAAFDVTVARSLLGADPDLMAHRVHELESSRARVVDAGQVERRKLERDLHDGTQQQLVSLGMLLGRAQARHAHDPTSVGPLIDQAHQQAKDAVTDLRLLLRGLHPPVLTDRGLDAALSAITARCPIPVDLHVDIDERPPATIESIGYFVAAEALTNVAKHSGATRAVVTVDRHDAGPITMTISDDGVGGADAARGTGLNGLAGRVAGVDGEFRVDSPVGGPTVLTVELPCDGGT